MRKLIKSVALALLSCVSVQAATTTPRLGLTIPAKGDTNWDIQLRNDFNIIDSSVSLSSSSVTLDSTQTFTADQTFLGHITAPVVRISTGGGIFFLDESNPPLQKALIELNQFDPALNQLEISANRTIGLNAYIPGISTIGVVMGGSGVFSPGSFAVTGSSANSSITYTGFISTFPVQQSILWSLPSKDGTNGQAIITNGSGALSFGSVAGGGGGSLPLPGGATNYIQNSSTLQTGATAYPDFLYVGSGATFSSMTANTANFNGPALSTVTYGMAVGSITVNGTGDGTITLTIGGSPYTVTSSSTTNAAFHMAGWNGSTNQLIDIGLPIAPGGFGTINAGTAGLLSYYNIAGSTLSQVTGSLVTASSVTLPQTIITSTFNVTVGGGTSLNTPASVNIFINGDTIGQTRPFAVGTQQHNDQLYLLDHTYFHSEYGFRSSDLSIGNSAVGTTKIESIQSTNQFLDMYNNGEIDLQTATFATGDIVLKPETVEVLRVSTNSVSMVGTSNSRYTLRLTTGTAGVLPYQIAFTTMGVVSVSSNAVSSPVLTSCGTNPIAVGNSHVFQITGGSASTGCIATFPAGTYRNPPSCSISQESMSVINALTYSATATALTISQTGLGTGKLDIICHGLNE